MASSMNKLNDESKNVESKQLLYSDVFGQSYQEERLRILGKTKTQDHLQTFSVPHSSVLSQIKSFLPRLSDANLKMTQDIEKNPDRADEINIECVDDASEEKHIEMSISMIPTGGQDILQGSDSEESGESCDDDEDDDDDGVLKENSNDDAEDSCQKDSSKEIHRHFWHTDGKTAEQHNLMKLKMPSLNKTSKKQKPHIEEIEINFNSFVEESTNR